MHTDDSNSSSPSPSAPTLASNSSPSNTPNVNTLPYAQQQPVYYMPSVGTQPQQHPHPQMMYYYLPNSNPNFPPQVVPQLPMQQPPQHQFISLYPPSPSPSPSPTPSAMIPQIPPNSVEMVQIQPAPESRVTNSELQTPLIPTGAALIQTLTSRTYEVTICKWMCEGWGLYKQHWAWYSFMTLIMVLVAFIPDVGHLLSFPLMYGLCLAATNSLKSDTSSFSPCHFFHGYKYFFPLVLMHVLYSLLCTIGFALLIVPGIYLAVTLSFWSGVWLEYRGDGVGILQSAEVSRVQISKRFFKMFWFLIVVVLMQVASCMLFMVPLLLTAPIGLLTLVVAFQDIFGLSKSQVPPPSGCVCC